MRVLSVLLALIGVLLLFICGVDARIHHQKRSDSHYLSIVKHLTSDSHFRHFVERSEIAQSELSALLPADEFGAEADSAEFQSAAAPSCANPHSFVEGLKKMKAEIASQIHALAAKAKHIPAAGAAHAVKKSAEAEIDSASEEEEEEDSAVTDSASEVSPGVARTGRIAKRIVVLPLKVVGGVGAAVVGGGAAVIGGGLFISAILITNIVNRAICGVKKLFEVVGPNYNCSSGDFNGL